MRKYVDAGVKNSPAPYNVSPNVPNAAKTIDCTRPTKTAKNMLLPMALPSSSFDDPDLEDAIDDVIIASNGILNSFVKELYTERATPTPARSAAPT
jgi:hypothetical protein